ncbi:MAG: hypothetical protein AAGG56_03865 [Pseudomonadota bacterium]
MNDEKTEQPSRPEPPAAKSIKRIATHYSVEDIANGRAPTAILIYRFLERTKWRLYGAPVTLTEQAAEFLRTDDMSYSDDDIRRLEGDYFMYRRYWLDPGQDLFMRSFLRIKKFHEGDVFLIREYQNWPDIDFQETAQGYLFPSGKAILGLMKSVQRTTVKFYSITNLSPNHKSSRALFSSFSGNGIAASDVPPHTGYGFHCKRIEKDRVPMSERVKSMRYTFVEMQNEHLQIFKEIIRYENFRGIDFGTKPPEVQG